MKRLILMSLTALALMLMTACGTADTEDNASSDNQGNGSSEVVEENEEEVVDETNETNEEATEDASEEVVEENEDEATENDTEVIREEAAYVGMQDPHSIEVTTETETLALQILDPGVEDVDFGAIEENAAVIIEYYQNEDGQNILTDIEIK